MNGSNQPGKFGFAAEASVANRRRASFRLRLASLVAACVLPVWIAAGFLVYYNYQGKRALTELRMLETARALAIVVDRELSNMQASLIALATSPSLVSGDLRAFHRQAGMLLKAHPDTDIILSDATGQQLINTFRPFGAPLPKRGEPDAVRQIYSAEKPIITNVFRGAVTGRLVISVDVPVFRDGRVVYDLAMVTPADRFSKVLSQQQLPPEWIGRILDSNQVVVARTHLAEQFAGRPAVPVMRQRMRDAVEGTQEAINFEGVTLSNSFSRSATYGWTVVIGVPKAIMMAEIWHWLWWTIAGTILLSLTGLTLALPIGRSVEKIEGGLRRLSAIVESSDDAIYSKSLDGVITTWNRGAERLFGYRSAEAIGQSMMLVVPPECHQELHDLLQRIRRGETVKHESERVCKDGRRVHASVTISPLKDDRGEITGASVVARDITDRKRAGKALQKAALYTRSLIEASLDPLVTISREGKITGVNAATEKVTGISREGLIGSDFSDYFTEPEKARQGYQQVFAEGVVRDYPLAIRSASGAVTDVLYNASVFRNETNEVEGVFAAARDITERKRVEQELARLNTELEQRVLERTAELTASNKELEAFTYSVSHDLRAPLRHIDGFSKMLLERYGEQLDAKGRHYLEEVRGGTRNMGRLVDELLALSRVGRQEPRLQVVGLNSLFEEVRTELMKETGDRQIEWRIATLPFVECDPALMRQAVSNLLANAVKFTRPCDRAVIEAGQMQQASETVIFVRDNGVGFNMKYADKLFGVFQRLHRAEDFEGTGVGLATVQRIIHKHNGRVWAEAELNKGATFYFTLGGSQTGTPTKVLTAARGE